MLPGSWLLLYFHLLNSEKQVQQMTVLVNQMLTQ